jgi:hypothetical protein
MQSWKRNLYGLLVFAAVWCGIYVMATALYRGGTMGFWADVAILLGGWAGLQLYEERHADKRVNKNAVGES